jgi:hypothetical protein
MYDKVGPEILHSALGCSAKPNSFEWVVFSRNNHIVKFQSIVTRDGLWDLVSAVPAGSRHNAGLFLRICILYLLFPISQGRYCLYKNKGHHPPKCYVMTPEKAPQNRNNACLNNKCGKLRFAVECSHSIQSLKSFK